MVVLAEARSDRRVERMCCECELPEPQPDHDKRGYTISFLSAIQRLQSYCAASLETYHPSLVSFLSLDPLRHMRILDYGRLMIMLLLLVMCFPPMCGHSKNTRQRGHFVARLFCSGPGTIFLVYNCRTCGGWCRRLRLSRPPYPLIGFMSLLWYLWMLI